MCVLLPLPVVQINDREREDELEEAETRERGS
jgi:hypothetical protein